MSTVEAPQYRRYALERRRAEGMTAPEAVRWGKRMGFGIRDGNGIIFVSHLGDVCPAGFLPLVLGNVRRTPLPTIYRHSARLAQLRDMNAVGGKCGRCARRAEVVPHGEPHATLRSGFGYFVRDKSGIDRRSAG